MSSSNFRAFGRALIRPLGLLIAAGVLASSLSGCIIEPAHPYYDHPHYWYYR